MIERTTSASILEKMQETARLKDEEHRKRIGTIAWTMQRNVEAITKLIELSGELHIDLLDERGVESILKPYYEADKDVYYRTSHSAATAGMAYLSGNAHIYPHPETGADAVRIVATFRFKRDFLPPKLLTELLEVFKRSIGFGDGFSLISVHRYPAGPGISRIEDGSWDLHAEERDGSIVVTLS